MRVRIEQLSEHRRYTASIQHKNVSERKSKLCWRAMRQIRHAMEERDTKMKRSVKFRPHNLSKVYVHLLSVLRRGRNTNSARPSNHHFGIWSAKSVAGWNLMNCVEGSYSVTSPSYCFELCCELYFCNQSICSCERILACLRLICNLALSELEMYTSGFIGDDINGILI